MSAPTTATEAPVRFVSPPPGLGSLTDFTLTGVTDALYSLRAIDAAEVRLFLLDPRQFFPDYAPRVSKEALADLGTEEPAVLVVVRPGDGEAPTANLLAPVLLNLDTGAALQTILEGSSYPLRAPVGD